MDMASDQLSNIPELPVQAVQANLEAEPHIFLDEVRRHAAQLKSPDVELELAYAGPIGHSFWRLMHQRRTQHCECCQRTRPM
eukprot:m.118590 g.118590  ORF g.118590 m.118590 type:complete len:82 (-) comp9236_c0_seq1:1557-1802(-)